LDVYTFGRQNFIPGVVNDGLYIDPDYEKAVRHAKQTI